MEVRKAPFTIQTVDVLRTTVAGVEVVARTAARHIKVLREGIGREHREALGQALLRFQSERVVLRMVTAAVGEIDAGELRVGTQQLVGGNRGAGDDANSALTEEGV